MKLTLESPEAKHAKIYWNDQYLKCVLEADDVEGYVLMHVWNGSTPILDDNGDIAVIRLEGVVRIEV